eukprot:TRINITY_DN35030_c0_g1_i2.p1 TRINITY_DN35030_c0_g1~~TRINITY_DN35030_c0_g1_i2.p1  ORF type:complete len:198 (+),score=21.91 TRINITY_DN35030_c0_g1_i2:254-847(+)
MYMEASKAIEEEDGSIEKLALMQSQFRMELGYYIFDTIADLLDIKYSGLSFVKFGFVLHHAVPLVGLPLGMAWHHQRGKIWLDMITSCLFAVNLTTPLQEFRWMLDALKCSPTRLIYRLNFFTFLVTFFVFRILVNIHLFKLYRKYHLPLDTPLWKVLVVIPKICATSTIILLGINLFWFSIHLKRLPKVLGHKKRQ